MKNIMTEIQTKLKAPKGQFNKFGNFYYRSCEDILEAVKPLLAECDSHITLSDELMFIGERMYIKSTASIFEGKEFLASSTAYAREPYERKGMDQSQITGSATSYARKSALGGLLALDDTKDEDAKQDELMHGKVDTKPINFERVHDAVDFFVQKIDEDQIEKNWEIMKAAERRLTRDESQAVGKLLSEKGKAPNSNKKYSTLLKEYMEYKPIDNPDNYREQ